MSGVILSRFEHSQKTSPLTAKTQESRAWAEVQGKIADDCRTEEAVTQFLFKCLSLKFKLGVFYSHLNLLACYFALRYK